MKHIAIIFAKEENLSFNRFTFPILGRPIIKYPILAALNSIEIQSVFLSTDSNQVAEIGKNMNGLNLLIREHSQPTLTEEVRNAVHQSVKLLGDTPRTVTILLGNSPCILPTMIDNNISQLEKNPSYHSVASAMHRAEFSPDSIFDLKENHLIRRTTTHSTDNVYFLDRRIMTVKTDVILNSITKDDSFESVLGSNIYPVIQQDGIWDIDYIWQVPIVERWLKQNGFDDQHLSYKEIEKKNVENSSSQIGIIKKGEKRVFISTVPFGNIDPKPIHLLNDQLNLKYVINPIGRRLKEEECKDLYKDYDVVIAGTEKITRKVMENSKRLKLIARVGIGVDGVDLQAARDLGIRVTYTPDAPSAAVGELTIAHMLNLMRYLPLIDRKLRSGIWQRINGERIATKTIGIIGTGRIGSIVLRHLQGFDPRKILVNDLKPNNNLYEMYHAQHVDKETIYATADIISLHIPLSPLSKNLITKNEIEIMKHQSVIINTSRGGIINEKDLFDALKNNRITGAAIDVFEDEPYTGNLVELDNCFLSCHMGSMTNDCRAKMEIEATEDALRFINGKVLKQEVPEEEYNNQISFS
ncbi:MAG: hypothetical protein NTZ24_12320 [Deltaproteobacteria bacterium]|nr:hypothetical protein [Deltaproteobacteria bacterium]